MVEFFSHSPDSLDLSGKDELLVFALTFLTSTWYIKNPFLKSKINEVCTWNSSNGQCWYSCRRCSTVFYHMEMKEVGFWAECLTAILWHWNTWSRHWHTFILVGTLWHLSSILILRQSFQTEVEQTGASSQFYDKFSEYSSDCYEDYFEVCSIL